MLARMTTLVTLATLAAPARGQLPVSGVPVPELSAFDDAMQDFMAANGIISGVLADGSSPTASA